MTKLKRILDWIRHIDSHESRFHTLVHWLERKGILIAPSYLTLETGTGIPQHKEIKGYTVRFLGPKDVKELAEMPGRFGSLEEFSRNFKEEKKCIGVQHKGKIVAFTWCNLSKCDSRMLKFDLKQNEAYIFDAFTHPAYRGMGLAPFMRLQLYQLMKKHGRHRFYSITEAFNRSAIKLKHKVGGEFLFLGLYVELFKKFKRVFKLKKYRE